MTNNQNQKIPKRILASLIASVSAGVVPRSGAPYIAIGREEELGSLLDNLDDVADGGAACRFLIGRYGSGKSFLIQLIRGMLSTEDLSPQMPIFLPKEDLLGVTEQGWRPTGSL